MDKILLVAVMPIGIVMAIMFIFLISVSIINYIKTYHTKPAVCTILTVIVVLSCIVITSINICSIVSNIC